MTAQAVETVRNDVTLAGRVAAPPEERTLPSGDKLVSFRLVVARPEGSRGPSVDTFDCAAWAAAVRKAAVGWQPGDVVEVHGALRRRFWRGAGGAASRTEVEVLKGRRLVKAPP